MESVPKLHSTRSVLHPLVTAFQCWFRHWQAPLNYTAIRSLGELGRCQSRVRFDPARTPVPGWLTPAEQRALYSLGRWAPGPFLEIGPWLGLSTTALALGIADSDERKEFISCEINPTLANFRPTADGMMGLFLPAESTVSMGPCTVEVFERDIKPVVGHPDGLGGQLLENLRRCGADKLVRVVFGDFRNLESKSYGLVFCDAMHTETEILRNAPDLRRNLTAGSILSCHDTTDENAHLLHQLFAFGDTFRVDSLFVGEIPRV